LIELIHITKKISGRRILEIPHLTFSEGRRYALIGENGSGKTTLLRIMAGILKADTGRLVDIPVDSMGYMPQSPYAFSFSVQKNVEIALANSTDATNQALIALKAVGLFAMAAARGNKLSGGETQRMAFARMIAKPRRLILLDEPTSATDIKGMDQIETLLLQYASRTGSTIIFSTHSPAQALRLAEWVIFLDQGKIAEQGPAKKVLKKPQNESAKLFLQHWKI
jgi:tungstate transport system ATP-binding protein